MRLQGRLSQWDDDKGFGFVTPNGGGDRAFVHIKAFERAARRPVDGDILTYATARDAQGRLQATAIRFATAPVRPTAAPRRGWFGPVLAGAFALALAGLIATGRLPVHAGTLYGVMSVVTLIVYGVDKQAATAGRWRTPEVHLHLLALLGGWPGALLAQRWFRHKSSKAEFQRVFRAIVVINLLALGWYAKDAFHTP
ncbi:MAG: DUF1294 domain-containing protein [Xanthomonadales bacterium]|nr:DUF1294 domain-containing protein [Xanthomonadales bacterium]